MKSFQLNSRVIDLNILLLNNFYRIVILDLINMYLVKTWNNKFSF